MQWRPNSQQLNTTEVVLAEWKRALEAKETMDPEAWKESANRLRAIAAVMRDAHMPFGPDHHQLAALVDDISKHLKERRTLPR